MSRRLTMKTPGRFDAGGGILHVEWYVGYVVIFVILCALWLIEREDGGVWLVILLRVLIAPRVPGVEMGAGVALAEFFVAVLVARAGSTVDALCTAASAAAGTSGSFSGYATTSRLMPVSL